MLHSPSLERSADSLAALFNISAAFRTDGERRLDLLHWLLHLPAEIDPAEAAQILIGRQLRGESARFAETDQAMLAELGLFDRSRLAAMPRSRRRQTGRD
jgi:hypothetical protein